MGDRNHLRRFRGIGRHLSLDDYFSSRPAPDFIKCDVKGAEFVESLVAERNRKYLSSQSSHRSGLTKNSAQKTFSNAFRLRDFRTF